ncbi:MAG TPA: glycosyltransferase family 2 protein [Urbifossiella sp.]|jgi:dolichol-phosphate mannosyltransferase|nr:glycosyltransferase family 2 protein [Urbifossiella sp.]
MPPRPRLSIVCPAYQEEEVLPRFHAALAAAIDPLADGYDLEVLYVDDGSRDRTLDVIRGFAAADPRVRYVSLRRNFGHQAALTAGLDHATGDAVVSLDSDLQHPPAVIPLLVEKWREGYDVVLTIRGDDRRLGWFKRASSRGFYRLLSWVSSVEVRPAAADFRLMSRQAVDELGRLREAHRFVRGMVQWLGFRVAEVPFQPAARQGGVSKYTLRRMCRFAADGLLSFSPAPARLTVAAGLAVTGLCWVASLAAIAALVPLTNPYALAGLVTLTTLHAVAAAGLVTAGVLGELAARTYEQSKGRPLYVVKESSADTSPAATRLPRAA